MAAPPLLYTAVLTTVPVFAMYKLQAFHLIRNARLWLWLLWLDAAEHQVQQVRMHLFRYYNWTTQPCRIGNRLSVCLGLPPLPAGEPLTVRGWGGGGWGGYSARTSNSWSYFRLKNVISGGSLYQGSTSIKANKHFQNPSRKSQQITQFRSSNFVGEAVWNVQILRLLV